MTGAKAFDKTTPIKHTLDLLSIFIVSLYNGLVSFVMVEVYSILYTI